MREYLNQISFKKLGFNNKQVKENCRKKKEDFESSKIKAGMGINKAVGNTI